MTGLYIALIIMFAVITAVLFGMVFIFWPGDSTCLAAQLAEWWKQRKAGPK